MSQAVGETASELLSDEEGWVEAKTREWQRALQRSIELQELYPSDGTAAQKAAFQRTEEELREELLSLENDLKDGYGRLSRARADIELPSCPSCWVNDGTVSEAKREIDYRYDRTHHYFECEECGWTGSVILR